MNEIIGAIDSLRPLEALLLGGVAVIVLVLIMLALRALARSRRPPDNQLYSQGNCTPKSSRGGSSERGRGGGWHGGRR